MISLTMRGVRLGLMLAAAGAVVPSLAAGQSNRAQLPPGAVVQPLPQDDGAELRRNLTTLADNPQSVDALVGAGRTALDSGDTNAALSFFSRALEVAPRDARAKAGMASVMVRMERAQPALNLFAEAVALGAPELEIAGDRGLAHDLLGNPRRAQQDYALVLQRREDPEVRRRLALSLAISGERDAALRAIDAQLRRNERAAWRTQAFVLALTGDSAGANRTAQSMMPAPAAQAMAPFFQRMAALSPAQKAMAAHFGHFPSNGRTAATSGGDTSADPGALALATGGAQPAPVRTQPTQTASRDPRRRPGSVTPAVPVGATRIARSPPRSTQEPESSGNQRPVRVGQADTSGSLVPPVRTGPPPATQSPASQPPASQPPASPPANQPQPQGSVNVPTPSLGTIRVDEGRLTIPATTDDRASRPAQERAAGVTDSQPSLALATPTQPRSQPPGAGSTNSGPSVSPGLSDIAAVVASLPEDQAGASRPPASESSQPSRAPAPTVTRGGQGTTTRPATQPAARRQPARPAHPSRHWVQIAGGANAAGLPRELARLRQQAPELARQNAWVTPANATNRLLVGPFASSREAQEFVNTLARRDVSAFAWTSPAGQEVSRLQPGR